MNERQVSKQKMKAALNTLRRWGREHGNKTFLLSLKKLTNRQAYKLLVNRGYEWRNQRWQMTPKYMASKRKLKALGLFSQYAGQSADTCYRALLRRHYWYTSGNWQKRDMQAQSPFKPKVAATEPTVQPRRPAPKPKVVQKPMPEVDFDKMTPDQVHAYVVANQGSIRAAK